MAADSLSVAAIDMRNRSIVIFWAILMLTALAVGIGFVHLIRHEGERLDNAWQRAARREAEALAAGLCRVVAELEQSLGQRLRSLDRAAPESALADWTRSDPLVRNTFVWRDGELRYPRVADGTTPEEQRFIARYAPLFSERIPWRDAPADEPGQDALAAAASAAPARSAKLRPLMARARMADAAAQPMAAAPGAGGEVFWKPWFSGENFYLLAYFVSSDGRLVYGAEIEFAALLARLIPLFAVEADQGLAFALRDHRGETVQTAGDGAVDIGNAAALIDRVTLAPALPNWQVEVYGATAALGGAGLLAAGTALGLILVLAIVACGSMLYWLARRNMLEAARKTSFVSNVSHELKTPLTTIRMYAEMLGEKRVPEAERREHYLKVIIEQSRRLTRLVDNVLDFSRIEQQRKRYRIEPLDAVAEARAVIENQRPRIEQSGLALKLELLESCALRPLDRDVLEQVLINLLDNAIKYASEGGEVMIEWREPGCIACCDRGPGIPHSQRERIFRSYHRVDDSLTARQSGCGLGLTIARQLLRGIGGELTYEQRPGGGACFLVRLPEPDPELNKEVL